MINYKNIFIYSYESICNVFFQLEWWKKLQCNVLLIFRFGAGYGPYTTSKNLNGNKLDICKLKFYFMHMFCN